MPGTTAGLRAAVGDRADAAVRDLTAAWIREWDALSPVFLAALTGLAATAVRLGRWPGPWELVRDPAVAAAVDAMRAAMARLSAHTDATVTDSARRAIDVTLESEPAAMAAQLDAADRKTGKAMFAASITAATAAVLGSQSQARILRGVASIGEGPVQAARWAIVRGVPLGVPAVMAALLLRAVEGSFNTGLTRALSLTRVEVADASREASRQVRGANLTLVTGWRWICRLAPTSCLICVVMHGTVHPASSPGPEGHVGCMCLAAPIVQPGRWALAPVADGFVDGRTWFGRLPEHRQVALAGVARINLLRSGLIDWTELVVLRHNAQWRPAYALVPVRDLQRLADARRRRNVA